MSYVIEESKDSASKDTEALDHNVAHIEAEERPGPVAGWFVQKQSQSRNYNDGKATVLCF